MCLWFDCVSSPRKWFFPNAWCLETICCNVSENFLRMCIRSTEYQFRMPKMIPSNQHMAVYSKYKTLPVRHSSTFSCERLKYLPPACWWLNKCCYLAVSTRIPQKMWTYFPEGDQASKWPFEKVCLLLHPTPPATTTTTFKHTASKLTKAVQLKHI